MGIVVRAVAVLMLVGKGARSDKASDRWGRQAAGMASTGLRLPIYLLTHLGLVGEGVVEDEVAQLHQPLRPPRHLCVGAKGVMGQESWQ